MIGMAEGDDAVFVRCQITGQKRNGEELGTEAEDAGCRHSRSRSRSGWPSFHLNVPLGSPSLRVCNRTADVKIRLRGRKQRTGLRCAFDSIRSGMS